MQASAGEKPVHRNHIRSGIWFALSVVFALAAWFGGNELYTRLVILPRSYPPLQPGTVNLLGLQLKGFRIIVSNGIARLQEGSDDTFSRPEDSSLDSGGTIVPMKGLILALQQKPEGVSELLEAFAGIKREIEPRPDIIWKREDVIAALKGDKGLREKLETALCTILAGGAVQKVSWRRLQDGIWIRTGVPVKITTPSGTETVEGEIEIPYKTRTADMVEKRIKKLLEQSGKLAPDGPMVAGVYSEEAGRVKENVAQTLAQLASDSRLRALAEPVENLLSRVIVLLTEKQITGAEVQKEPKPQGDGFLYSILLDITTDARDRLWQFTYRNPHSQLLFVSNGVAIAAPFVRHEMKYSKVTITNITDEDLANEAISFIKGRTGE